MPDHVDDMITDRERLDWMAQHPLCTKWCHKRGWIVSYSFPFDEVNGPTLRAAIDAAITKTRDIPSAISVLGSCRK